MITGGGYAALRPRPAFRARADVDIMPTRQPRTGCPAHHLRAARARGRAGRHRLGARQGGGEAAKRGKVGAVHGFAPQGGGQHDESGVKGCGASASSCHGISCSPFLPDHTAELLDFWGARCISVAAIAPRRPYAPLSKMSPCLTTASYADVLFSDETRLVVMTPDTLSIVHASRPRAINLHRSLWRHALSVSCTLITPSALTHP